MPISNANHKFNVRPEMWICLFLVLSTLFIYIQVGTFEFDNYDTANYVYHNQQVKAGLTVRGIHWAFTTTYFSNWHPLTWLSHMLDVQLYGLHAGRHHLTSVILHIVNTILLFGVLRRMSGALWQAGFAAALFALHPLHVETVAWVAERKDLLSALFSLLALWFYRRYVQYPGIGRYLPVLLFFILGLMSKPMVVTLPFVLLLLDYWPLKRFHIQMTRQIGDSGFQWHAIVSLIAEKIPLFIFSAASCIITFYAQRAGGSVAPIDSYPLYIRILNALNSYMSYIGKMIWPSKLAVFYPYNSMLPSWRIWSACFLLIGVSLLAIKFYKSRPWLLVGWMWYLGTLVPVIGFLQVGSQALADRYTYIPLIGLFIVIAWGLFELLRRWRYNELKFIAILLAVVGTLMPVSWQQVRHWKNSLVLFQHAINVTENNYVAHNNLGLRLMELGETNEAVKHYKRALETHPLFETAHLNLGLVYSSQGKLAEAIHHYSKALEINPNYPVAYNNLGKIENRLGAPDRAIPRFRQAIKYNPQYAEAYNNLGVSLYRSGKIAQAIPNYLKAIRIKPSYAEAYNNAGAAMIKLGEINKAVALFREAVRIAPDYIEAQNNLSNTLAALKTLNDRAGDSQN